MKREGQNRIGHIDFLKAVGLLGVFIAHAEPPLLVAQIRNFDVVLLVFVSSMLSAMSFSGYQAGKEGLFVRKRLKRLLVPTWVFLLFYFLFWAMKGMIFSKDYYLSSFLLTRYGIGYVWVIRIYLFCAILVPLFLRKRVRPLGVVFLYVIYEWTYRAGLLTESRLAMSTWYDIVPWGVVVYLGCRYLSMTDKEKRTLFVGFTGLFLLIGAALYYLEGHFVLTQSFKYPARAYYLSYGLAVTFGLFLVCERHSNCKLFQSKPVRFLSKHSLWLYFWHIGILSILYHLEVQTYWMIELLILVVGGSLLVWLQTKVKTAIVKTIKKTES